MGECPLCGESTSKPSTRLIKESCGHSKCRLCLLNEENGCSVCEGNNGDISLSTIESIGNFDYRLPATTIPNYEELHTSPRKLDFNKLPDDFNDCALDASRLTIDDSITPNSEDILAGLPGPQKVDIGTETEDIVTEEEEEEVQPAPEPVQHNTHSTHSPVVQTPTQAAAKLPQVFADSIGNNHVPQPETPVVQNTGFIPVTQRADGRQFITIAFIANSSPNKNQHVVTPMINQCMPAIGNMTAVQRSAGNQCIPMIGNINALQSPAGGQFIIRNPNIVQNLVGNQSIPIIGNLNTMQNLTTSQPMPIMANVNVAKTVATNQPLPSFATVNALKSATKGQTFPATASQNIVQNVVGNQPYQVTQAVPNVENQPAPSVEENVNTTRKQVRRGLPRIKTVKNVNIVQKSLPNQSDKVNSQIENSPMKGRRQRKELPVYLVPKKLNQKTNNVSAKSPAQVVGCMSPEYKLEDYLLFNKQQQADELAAKEAETKTEINTTNYTQINNEPQESVINESLIANEQHNCTLTEKKPVENKTNGLEQESQDINEKTDDKKNIKDLKMETDNNKEHQDLNVIFNIRDECKQTAKEEIGDDKDKFRVPNGETSNKEDYQNLDALFDIIEKESEKLNGGIFDKEAKLSLDGENGLAHVENQKLHEKMDSEEDSQIMLDQPIKTVTVEEEKDHDLNGDENQHLNKDENHQITEIENLDKPILNEKEINETSNEVNHEVDNNLVEGLPVENCAGQDSDELAESSEEKQTEMENEKENSETQNETKESQAMDEEALDDTANSPFANDEINIKESNSAFDEKVAAMEKSASTNGELCHEKEENQCIEREISTTEENSHNVNKMSDEEGSQDANESIVEKEKINQTLYEDISEAENDNVDLNREKPELQYTSNDDESSCHCSDDKTLGEESPMSDTKLDSADENSNQNPTVGKHREENVSSASDVEEDSPAYETMSDPEYGDSDEASDSQDAVMEKPSGIRETSMISSEPGLSSFKLPNECDQEKYLSAKLSNLSVVNKEGDGKILENKDDSVTQDKEDASLQTSVYTNSILSETPNEELLVKGKRGRKKKSWSDYEVDIKPKKQKQQKNQQSVVKKSRGRPKKSLSNLEQPNNQQTDSSLEAKQSTHKESQDKHFYGEENQSLDQSSRLDISNKKEESFDSDAEAKLVIVEKYEPQLKKPRGRPKSKNVSFNLDEPSEPEVSHVKQQPIVKKLRGRPKKSLSNLDQSDALPHALGSPSLTEKSVEESKLEVSHSNEQQTVKKSRGRPKKSLSNVEQPNIQTEAESSIATEPSVEYEKANIEESNGQQFDKENEYAPDAVTFSQEENHDLTAKMDEEEESLPSKVDTNVTSNEINDSSYQEPNTADMNEQPIAVKKSRGRPKKSLSRDKPIVKKPIGRPRKSLPSFEQPSKRDITPEAETSVATEISQQYEQINEKESKDQHSNEVSQDEDHVLDREDLNQNETSQVADTNDKEQENWHSDITSSFAVTESDAGEKPIAANDNERVTVVKKARGRPKKVLPSLEQPSKRVASPEPAAATEMSNQCEQTNEKESRDQQSNDVSQSENHILNKKDFIQDETSQDADVNGGEQESLNSDVTSNFAVIESDVSEKPNNVNDNEQPSVVKKSRGRPKKSLPSFEQPRKRDATPETKSSVATEISNESEQINDEESKNQDSDEVSQDEDHVLNKEDINQDETSQSVNMNDREQESLHSNITTTLAVTDKNESDAGEKSNAVNNNEHTPVIKKPRGRPKKILPSFELTSNRDVSQEPEPSVDTEVSEQINQVPSKDQYSNEGGDAQEDRIINRQGFSQDESSQDLSADTNGGEQERESLHSDVTSSLAVVESEAGEKPIAANNNENINVVKKQKGRPRKSLSLDEQPSKKPRGRPRKSLPSFAPPSERDRSQEKEQSVEQKVSDVHNENDQIQSLNGTLEENSQTLDKGELQASNLSMQTEDESLNLEDQVSTTDHENSVDQQLNVTRESEQSVKKTQGRPKTGKPRGRPKKLNHEQHQEDNSSLNSHDTEEQNEQTYNQVSDATPNEESSSKLVLTASEESIDDTIEPHDSKKTADDEGENQILQKETDEQEANQDLKTQDDENKENKEKYSEKDDGETESVTSATEEQDLDKSAKADDEVMKNNTSARKYKSFDRMNTQVIVENAKRKRKPKVLLYENEDLEISTKKKKKNDANTPTGKSESRKSLENAPVKSSPDANESSLDSTPIVKSPLIKVKKMDLTTPTREKETTESSEKSEGLGQNESLLLVDENSMDSESVSSTAVSSQKDEDKKSAKRQRRPKILLYENEAVSPKSIKKKKVEFMLPAKEDSLDSSTAEISRGDGGILNSTLDVSTDSSQVPSSAKKSGRGRKPKNQLHKNESLSTRVKGKNAKSQIKKEDLKMMQRFGIKLQAIVVLEKLTNPIYLKRYNEYVLKRGVVSSKKSGGRPKKFGKESTLDKRLMGRPKKSEYSHIVKLPGEPSVYKCSVCKESFENYALRTAHIACVKTVYKCEFCPKKFYKGTHLQYHQLIHQNEKPYACDLCGKRFVQKYKLNRHVLVHKYLPDLECNECGRKFTSKEYLKSHLLSHVQSSFVYSCNHCPKSFTLDSTRKRHELSHSMVALFKCLRCPKSFKTQFEVTRHVRRHQRMRPFACHDCNKTFVTKEEVKRHTIIHSGEKNYTCKHCQQHFGRSDNFNRHMLHHHREDSLQPCSASSYDNTPEEDDDASSSKTNKQEKTKDQSSIKPKKISRTSSNPVPTPISFAHPLTPQSAPSPYSVSHNHDLASVIRETLPDLMNAVPVISSPISVHSSSSLMDPIPLEQALVLNRQIEEKIYTQNSFCEFPGLTRRNVTIVSRRPSYSYERRDSSESNSNSNDGTSFLTMNHERFEEQQVIEEINTTKKDIHVHWRRRTAETLKSKMDQNQ